MFRMFVALLGEFGNVILGLILVVLALMFVGYFVFVEPGQVGTSAKQILFSLGMLLVLLTILAIIPSILDGMIGFCSRMMHL